MENTKKIRISLNDIYPDIKKKIENGGTVRLPITGISMRPLLVWGRDTVDLIKCETLKKATSFFTFVITVSLYFIVLLVLMTMDISFAVIINGV